MEESFWKFFGRKKAKKTASPENKPVENLYDLKPEDHPWSEKNLGNKTRDVQVQPGTTKKIIHTRPLETEKKTEAKTQSFPKFMSAVDQIATQKEKPIVPEIKNYGVAERIKKYKEDNKDDNEATLSKLEKIVKESNAATMEPPTNKEPIKKITPVEQKLDKKTEPKKEAAIPMVPYATRGEAEAALTKLKVEIKQLDRDIQTGAALDKYGYEARKTYPKVEDMVRQKEEEIRNIERALPHLPTKVTPTISEIQPKQPIIDPEKLKTIGSNPYDADNYFETPAEPFFDHSELEKIKVEVPQSILKYPLPAENSWLYKKMEEEVVLDSLRHNLYNQAEIQAGIDYVAWTEEIAKNYNRFHNNDDRTNYLTVKILEAWEAKNKKEGKQYDVKNPNEIWYAKLHAKELVCMAEAKRKLPLSDQPDFNYQTSQYVQKRIANLEKRRKEEHSKGSGEVM